MTCAACGAPLLDSLTPIGGLVSCPSCLRTVVHASGALATAVETLALSPDEVDMLKAQRKAARKARLA
jgi:hypothetical protein